MTAATSPETTPARSHEYDLIEGVRRRVLVSIAGGVGWVCFTLLYVAFWAHAFSIFQSVIVVIVSLLILGGILAGSWVSFGMRLAGRWTH